MGKLGFILRVSLGKIWGYCKEKLFCYVAAFKLLYVLVAKFPLLLSLGLLDTFLKNSLVGDCVALQYYV